MRQRKLKLTKFERGYIRASEKAEQAFEAVAAKAPEVWNILDSARAMYKDHEKYREHFTEWFEWYQVLKPRLAATIGWHAKTADPSVQTQEAWDVVFKVVYAAIPVCKCRNCDGKPTFGEMIQAEMAHRAAEYEKRLTN